MLRLTITRDGADWRVLELTDGSHAIGRSPSCEICLDSQAVSGTHAVLDVSGAQAVVTDKGSLNGVFSKGTRIGKAAFRKKVEFDIAEFAFRGELVAEAKPLAALGRVRLGAPMLLSLTAIGLALAVFLVCSLPLRGGWRDQASKDHFDKGGLLVRLLAEANISALQSRQFDAIRIAAATAEEGVNYAYVTDASGKILAPPRDLGKNLRQPGVTQALREGAATVSRGENGEILLAAPIKDQGPVLGLAVVGLVPDSGASGEASLRLMLLALAATAALAGAAAWFLARAAAVPARRLAEEIGVAIKSGARTLNFTPDSPAMAELSDAAERLLVLARDGGQGRPAQPSPVQARSDQAPPETATPANPWLAVDKASSMVVAVSPELAPLLADPGAALPVHLLGAFADPGVFAAVAGLLESPLPGASAELPGTGLTAVVAPGGPAGQVVVECLKVFGAAPGASNG